MTNDKISAFIAHAFLLDKYSNKNGTNGPGRTHIVAGKRRFDQQRAQEADGGL